MSVSHIKRQAKQATKVLPEFLRQHTPPFSHSHCLELVSRLHGFPNFHAAQATDENRADQSHNRRQDDEDDNESQTVRGPWWCDTCGEKIEDVQAGYLIYKSTREQSLAHDFRIIHQTRCDPRGAYTGSIALKELVGGLGLAKLLSFLAVGPLLAERETSNQRVRFMEEIVDLIRRVQTPGYEAARRYFNDPQWRDRLSDWNEYAPYVPSELSGMLQWHISVPLDPVPHIDLTDIRYSGMAAVQLPEGKDEIAVVGTFDSLGLTLDLNPVTLYLGLCADGKYRGELVDDAGRADGFAELSLLTPPESQQDRVTLRGQWVRAREEACDFWVVLQAEH